MTTIPIDEQKKAILYAPKNLLWKLAGEEDAWLKLLGVVPESYYNQFVDRLRLLGVTDKLQIKAMAKVYVQKQIPVGKLQEALAAAWNPDNLEEAASFLKENGFLSSGESKQSSMQEVIAEAAAMPRSTRLRLARLSNGTKPKVGNPPNGASPEAAKCWNLVLRDPKKRKAILAPSKLEDQWALAHKFWLKECVDQGVPAYKGPADSGSSSMPAKSALRRSIHELHNSMCTGGYTMSRPAARLFRKLFDQLTEDGNDLGVWNSIRPKTPKGI